jgi:hypothetical protein
MSTSKPISNGIMNIASESHQCGFDYEHCLIYAGRRIYNPFIIRVGELKFKPPG